MIFRFDGVFKGFDYYPFGMVMPGRKFTSGNGYRYGFNGQEKSSEINEALNTALFWEYDSRIGRRWNIDPKTRNGRSGYLTFDNNPIIMIDPNGDDWYKNKKGDIYWFDSHSSKMKIGKNKLINIGETITIKTVSLIKYPNDLPLPNEELKEGAAGDKLITFITISPNYNDKKEMIGFKVRYSRDVGATFNLSWLLGVNYPDRPNTSTGVILNSSDNEPGQKFKTLNFKTFAHVTTPKIESIGLNLIGRKVDVSQDIKVTLIKNKLDVTIQHGSYPSVNMSVIGLRQMFVVSSYLTIYQYQQESFLTSHGLIYLIANYKSVKGQVQIADDSDKKLNAQYKKSNKAHYEFKSFQPD